jgi:hypothetical protein
MPSGFTVAGWAIDTGAESGTGVDAVHVDAYPNPGSGAAPIFLGGATYGLERPDVGAVFAPQFTRAGFSIGPIQLAPGPYLPVAFPHSTVSGQFSPPMTATITVGPEPDQTVALLTSDGAHVTRVRDSLRRGEPRFKDALAALEADANRALAVGPMSVMDKPITPPSGDKHDYMSQAPYWWPNPSTANGRPYIRRDGQRNPEIDRIPDRPNLGRLDDAVSSLGLAYFLTSREDYAQHAAHLVRVWFLDPGTRMNPNLRFGQGIPGIAKGRPAGIVETRFLPDIIDGVTFVRASAAWSTSDDAAFKAWMREYLDWLLTSPLGLEENRRGNNQETWYDVQVAALALYTEQPELARSNFEDAKTDIREEFEPDGRSIRQALEYLIPFATGQKRFPTHRLRHSIQGPFILFFAAPPYGLTSRDTASSHNKSAAEPQG